MGKAKRYNSIGHQKFRACAGALRGAAADSGIDYEHLLRVLDGMEPRAALVAYAWSRYGITPEDWLVEAANRDEMLGGGGR